MLNKAQNSTFGASELEGFHHVIYRCSYSTSKLQPETDNYIHSKMACIALTYPSFEKMSVLSLFSHRKDLPFRYFCGFDSNSVFFVVVFSNWTPCGTITLIDYL